MLRDPPVDRRHAAAARLNGEVRHDHNERRRVMCDVWGEFEDGVSHLAVKAVGVGGDTERWALALTAIPNASKSGAGSAVPAAA